MDMPHGVFELDSAYPQHVYLTHVRHGLAISHACLCFLAIDTIVPGYTLNQSYLKSVEVLYAWKKSST